MKTLRRIATGVLCAVALVVPAQLLGITVAQAATFTPLVLQNGWTNAPDGSSDAAVADIAGIVHLKGAIKTTGTNPVAFTLPAGFRPATFVYVPVGLCNGLNGRLDIVPSGVVTVQAEYGFSNAQCFTSLDGVSFATTAAVTPLTLENGWTGTPWETADAAVTKIAGIVHLKGAISTSGVNQVPFTLPAGDRPATNVYVPVDLCQATNGRLLIQPSGVVTVQAEQGHFNLAQCFTSLDGATFATSAASYTPLSLTGSWTNGPYGTSAAAVRMIDGIVHFKGAIANGTTLFPFTLPAAFRPTSTVSVKVDLCDANSGFLQIQPNGVVSVNSESDANVECFTSLDGAWFAP